MLAIVIPYYKIVFFEQTLQSLLKQTDKRFKVYIGDDASQQDPLPLLSHYKGEFDFVYHRFENNLGRVSLVKQWDRCISLISNEEWIMILGDDDELGSSCVADFYSNLLEINKYRCTVIRFSTLIIYELLGKKSQVFEHPQLEDAIDFFFRKLEDTTRSSLSEYVFSRNTYEKYGFKDYKLAWHSDDRAWFEFSDNKPIYSINSSQVNFRLSSDNISRPHFRVKEKLESSFCFFSFVFKKYFKSFNTDQKKIFLTQYEQLMYKNGKATVQLWVLLSLSFLLNRQFLQCVKFGRRFLIHLKNNAK